MGNASLPCSTCCARLEGVVLQEPEWQVVTKSALPGSPRGIFAGLQRPVLLGSTAPKVSEVSEHVNMMIEVDDEEEILVVMKFQAEGCARTPEPCPMESPTIVKVLDDDDDESSAWNVDGTTEDPPFFQEERSFVSQAPFFSEKDAAALLFVNYDIDPVHSVVRVNMTAF